MDQKLVMATVCSFHLSSLPQASQVPLMEGGNCGQDGWPGCLQAQAQVGLGWISVLIPTWGVGWGTSSSGLKSIEKVVFGSSAEVSMLDTHIGVLADQACVVVTG